MDFEGSLYCCLFIHILLSPINSNSKSIKQQTNSFFFLLYFSDIGLFFLVSFSFLCTTMSLVPSKNPTTSLVHPKLQNPKERLSLEHFSDDVVTNHVYTKHREDDKIKIDIDNYILLVESVIITADRITDSVSRV